MILRILQNDEKYRDDLFPAMPALDGKCRPPLQISCDAQEALLIFPSACASAEREDNCRACAAALV
jgi:hypothetical protein